MTHLESASRGKRDRFQQSVELFRERWRNHARRDDLAVYVEDDLLEVEYADGYPLRLGVSPHLAAIDAGRENEIEGLLEAYARQVSDLMSEVVRLTAQVAGDPRSAATKTATPSPPAPAPDSTAVGSSPRPRDSRRRSVSCNDSWRPTAVGRASRRARDLGIGAWWSGFVRPSPAASRPGHPSSSSAGATATSSNWTASTAVTFPQSEGGRSWVTIRATARTPCRTLSPYGPMAPSTWFFPRLRIGGSTTTRASPIISRDAIRAPTPRSARSSGSTSTGKRRSLDDRQRQRSARGGRVADLVSRVRASIAASIPPSASALVISKGDPALVDISGVAAAHFPQDGAGGSQVTILTTAMLRSPRSRDCDGAGRSTSSSLPLRGGGWTTTRRLQYIWPLTAT